MAKRVRQRSTEPERRPGRHTSLPQRTADVSAGAPPPVPTPLGGPERPGPEAVSLFEQAMQALQRHEYVAGAAAFRELLSRYPGEGALKERSLVYLALCERELARHPAEPRTIEERLTAATAALNNEDDDRAQSLAQSVLSDAPQHDLALYLLAVIEARRGATDEALHFLGRAMAINPEIRAQARHDADFEDLRDLDAFRELLESPVQPASEGQRRTRRNSR